MSMCNLIYTITKYCIYT